MKRLMLLGCLAILPLLAGTMPRTVSFAPEDLTFTKADGYDVIDLKASLPLVNPGAPRVPRLVQTIVIPADADPTGVELIAEEWCDLGTYNLGPAQPDVRLPRAGATFSPTVYSPDPRYYSSRDPYPLTKLRLLPSGTMSGYRLAHVELFPVRYIAATGQLQLATRLSYRLNYVEHRQAARLATARQSRVFGDIVRRLVVNPEDVDNFAPRVSPAAATTLPPGEYDYVIITEAPMDTVFQRLADWRTLKGVPSNVVTVSWIIANYPGYDNQEKIRNFIIDAHQTWGTIYVLLGGQGDYASSGQNIIPTRMANYGSNGDEPCDLYYAGLDGNWDRNGNHRYGEVADSADMYSDVFVGRAPVYNIANCQNFVRKVLTYEQNPPSGYCRRMILPTGILWSSYEERPMVESIARMTPTGWTDQRLYERTGNLSNRAVMDSMNAGVGMGHWDGHGNESGIYMGGGSTPFFTSTNADALVNGDRLGIHVSIACDCAAWDWVPNGDCLAEHIVMNPNGGGIASIMNTRYGYGAIGPGGNYVPGPSERLDTTFYAGVFNWGMPHTGQALAYSKASWAPYADSLYQYDMQRYCIYDLNLIGDPELPLYTDEPATLLAQHPGVVTIGYNVPYDVTVTTQGHVPIANAQVMLWKGSELYIRGLTNSSGQVTLLVSAPTPGPMVMSVNAHNYLILIDTVQVISTARYVAHLRSWIEDPTPGGNGDSILNPGETVRIPTWLKNWGSQTANSVTARLRTHDANAQITDSIRSFGNIAAGESAFTGSNGFGLHVNTGLSNGYAIACSLVCRDALDSSWVSNVLYVVGTPVLAKQSLVIKDTGIGNGNGRLDPDESVELEIEVRNTGGGHGYNCRGELRTGDSRLQVPDPFANYGYIRRGSSVSNTTDPYQVHADASIPLETPIPCTLYLYADGDYLATQVFNIIVGETRAIDPIPDGPRTPPRYYAYDDVDEGYLPHPTYNWVEINSVGTRINYSQNDAVVMINLPTEFGPLKFYGQRYTQLSISADGWLCPGNYTTPRYRNHVLPDTGTAPGMICLNWDDLYPVSGGGHGYVYYYHDAPNHRFIIEYDSVAYYQQTSVYEKFQALIYDTTTVTPTGDNAIYVQYMTANGYSSSTLGIEDPTRTIAICALFDGNYHRGCAQIAPRRVIAYLTEPPNPTALTEQRELATHPWQLTAGPNPVKGQARLQFSLLHGGLVNLRVYDLAGREVRTLVTGNLEPGRYTITWDTKDNAGRAVAEGIYIYRLTTGAGTLQHKAVLTR